MTVRIQKFSFVPSHLLFRNIGKQKTIRPDFIDLKKNFRKIRRN